MRIKTSHFFAIMSIIVLITIAMIPTFKFQFMLMALCLSIFFMSLAVGTKKTFGVYTLILMFSCTMSLAIVEIINWRSIPPYKIERTISKKDNITTHPLIKGDLKPYKTIHVSATYAKNTPYEEIVYDAIYTLDQNKHRITPKAPNAKTAVVILGCSYAFGSFIPDELHLGWLLGEKLGEDFQVYNLAQIAWGTHNIYDLIVSDKLPKKLSKYEKVLFYYAAIDDHQNRVAGMRPLYRDAPQYLLEEGKIVAKGKISDMPPFFWETPWGQFLKSSYTFNKHMYDIIGYLVPHNTTEKRRKITKALIEDMEKKLKAKYSNSLFTLLLWPPNIENKSLGLSSDINVVDMQEWFPNYQTDILKYIIPRDNHPSILANKYAAERMAELVLQDVKKIK